VAGSLYRTGPGEHKIEGAPDGTYYTSHWFDGLAHTHRFDITPGEDGRVTVHYSSRRQSDQWVDHIRKHGNRDLMTFGQRSDPCLGLFSKMMATWRARKLAKGEEFLVNPNVAVIPNFPGLGNAGSSNSTDDGHRGTPLPQNVWLTTDNSVLTQVNPATLEPIGRATQRVLHPDLKGPFSCAHAQRDPATGDLFNWNLEPGRDATYRIFRVRADTGKTEILAVIRGGRKCNVPAAYIHSFYLSASFMVLCIPSSHLAWDGLKVVWEGNLLDAIEPFDEGRKCQWFVVDRRHGRGVVARFETDAGFFFHTVNAFEERSEDDISRGTTTTLFCDVVEYPTLDVMSQLHYDVLLQRNSADRAFFGDETRVRNSRPRLARYSFTVPTTTVKPTDTTSTTEIRRGGEKKVFSIPSPHAGDLPTINPRYATRRHRYVYALAAWGRSAVNMDGLVKTDTLTRDALYWRPPHGHSPGEAVFVPRPGAQNEDDGVLLSVVLDGHARSSYLLCLDARTMTELGRAEVGFAVAIGLHGVHVSAGLGV
jgi:torulene dioxygenase